MEAVAYSPSFIKGLKTQPKWTFWKKNAHVSLDNGILISFGIEPSEMVIYKVFYSKTLPLNPAEIYELVSSIRNRKQIIESWSNKSTGVPFLFSESSPSGDPMVDLISLGDFLAKIGENIPAEFPRHHFETENSAGFFMASDAEKSIPQPAYITPELKLLFSVTHKICALKEDRIQAKTIADMIRKEMGEAKVTRMHNEFAKIIMPVGRRNGRNNGN